MKNRIVSILILFSFIILFNSCEEDIADSTSTGSPLIGALSFDVAVVGEIVSIYGIYFGLPSDSSYIYFDSTSKINSKKCITWNNSIIRFRVGDSLKTGTIRILIGSDTSNGFSITIKQLPDYLLSDVPSGSFSMGSNNGLANEKPVHIVTLTKAFKIGKYEVNQQLWSLVMKYNYSNIVGDFLPVNNVGWYESILFCNRYSVLNGLDTCYILTGTEVVFDTNANGFRLPTEAEWEYSCRAGSTSDYNGNGVLQELAWYNENSGMKPQVCGSKQENSWSIFDMHGNVSEWCWDRYNENYYSVSPLVNPMGADTGTVRVYRGGSCIDGKSYCRSSNRTRTEEYTKFIGLRIVKNKN